jgi:hypothetical protein
MIFDKLIIGGGLYGLYAALYSAKKGDNVLLIEIENEFFSRATYANQARVHLGYHYPRSISTAMKSAKYFKKFNDDFGFCIDNKFKQIYATSSNFSWTNSSQFKHFCDSLGIRCDSIDTSRFFKKHAVDGAFLTDEYTYDAFMLREHFQNEIKKFSNISIKLNTFIKEIAQVDNVYKVVLSDVEIVYTKFILNSTYASVNQINRLLNFETFNIKYELCEVIICSVSEKLKDIGLTVMDGPFFSLMPFGKTGDHSLTSVTFTPHLTSNEKLPTFECQKRSNGYCSPEQLGNCNKCIAKPQTAWEYMSKLAKKYLPDDIEMEYKYSLFSIKPILKISEIDDSRPTLIRKFSENPTFISVLSGKINTVYDLEEYL